MTKATALTVSLICALSHPQVSYSISTPMRWEFCSGRAMDGVCPSHAGVHFL